MRAFTLAGWPGRRGASSQDGAPTGPGPVAHGTAADEHGPAASGLPPLRLQARALACARGTRLLFSGLDLDLDPGEALWVRGRNGSGKSSLLRLLCGLGEPAEGQLLWQGRALGPQRAEYQRQLLWIGHAGGLKDELSALENLRFAARLTGSSPRPGELAAALARMGLHPHLHLPAGMLSQGQRRRVALARLFLPPTPPLWLLDEPFTALDAQTVLLLRRRLEGHLADGGLLVYTTHQPQRLASARRQQVLDLDSLRPAGHEPAPHAAPAWEALPC